MRKYSGEEFHESLKACGLQRGKGDTVLVHSSLLDLGLLRGCPVTDIPREMYDLLRAYLGDEGTIVVPTFNFSFGAGVPFERRHAPALAMGVFAEYVRRLPHSMRSSHPLESVSAIGPLAEKICAAEEGSSFAPGGPFHIMLEHDGVILFLGASMARASMAHYCEELFQVPYRYWFNYSGLYEDREHVDYRTYPMYVLNLREHHRASNFSVMERWLMEKNMLRRAELGSGLVKLCSFQQYVQVAMEKLKEDPFSLVRGLQNERRQQQYTGSSKGGLPHGSGIFAWPAGQQYKGQWVEGQMHGKGTFLFSDGTRYSGNYLCGKRHGTGEMIGPNGEKYSGEWKEGLRHGEGTMVVPHEHTYKGQWEKGLKHGRGTLTWPGGGRYEGQWNTGKMHGQGTLTLISGWSYAGEFKNGMLS